MDYVKNYMQSEEKEIIDLTCKLINAKTENPPGDEILAVRIVEDFFQSLQIPYKIFEKSKDRANIVGYIGEGETRLRYWLHAIWTLCRPETTGNRIPFEAWIENGRIYGRGASDNKGQMASMMAVARFLKENETKLKGQFILAGVQMKNAVQSWVWNTCSTNAALGADFAIILMSRIT